MQGQGYYLLNRISTSKPQTELPHRYPLRLHQQNIPLLRWLPPRLILVTVAQSLPKQQLPTNSIKQHFSKLQQPISLPTGKPLQNNGKKKLEKASHRPQSPHRDDSIVAPNRRITHIMHTILVSQEIHTPHTCARYTVTRLHDECILFFAHNRHHNCMLIQWLQHYPTVKPLCARGAWGGAGVHVSKY